MFHDMYTASKRNGIFKVEDEVGHPKEGLSGTRRTHILKGRLRSVTRLVHLPTGFSCLVKLPGLQPEFVIDAFKEPPQLAYTVLVFVQHMGEYCLSSPNKNPISI